MPRIVVVGAVGMGREADAWLADGRGADVVGFLDDDPARHGGWVAGPPVVGDLAWLERRADLEVVVAIRCPQRRAAIVNDGAMIGHDGDIGDGADVGAGAVVIRDVAPDTTVVRVPAAPITWEV